MYNQDNERSPPPEVVDFTNLIKSADAILIASPEHNYLPSAAIKNALDWGSRVYVDGAAYPSSVWNDKPLALMSAGGGSGGSKAQFALRQSAVFLNMHLVNKPEVCAQIWGPQPVFDGATGDVINDATSDHVKSVCSLKSFGVHDANIVMILVGERSYRIDHEAHRQGPGKLTNPKSSMYHSDVHQMCQEAKEL